LDNGFQRLDGSLETFKRIGPRDESGSVEGRAIVSAFEATARLGYPESTIVGIGVTLLVCTVLYLVPRTAVLGAILLTAYLGGAVASNVRAGTPFFNMVFPMLFGVTVWASLVLRNKHLESILLKAE